MSKKVSKLPFVDRKKFAKGVQMDPENQLVTLAVKEGETPDADKLIEAIESGGYKVEQIFVVQADGERVAWSP